uniref:Ribonuclease H-like domain-containing protein n=1 Tax=Tanacetum cinerariifolium TaxID=118510 RepID=A0A699H236_TANCI|nr:ribonuclease H-like domain-containing protein [Tanacetum cinerariifolium]
MVTRFFIGSNQPTQRLNLHVSSVSPLPKSYLDDFNELNWQNVMRDEYNALIKNQTWTLVPQPTDANIIRCTWLFRHKYLADATLSRYKARLEANGSTHIEGIDVDEAFSLVVKPGTIQTVLSLAASRHWPIHQLDYLTFTHPDISYAVQQVCLYMHHPREPHFSALKRVLRYVRGTLDYGLQLFSSSTADLVAYSDINWVGFPTTRRSTSEAEYCGVANVVAELVEESSTRHQRTKHIEIDIDFVLDWVAAAQVRVLHVLSRYQFADIFTKGLPSALFEKFRFILNVRFSAPLSCSHVLIFTFSTVSFLRVVDVRAHAFLHNLGGLSQAWACLFIRYREPNLRDKIHRQSCEFDIDFAFVKALSWTEWMYNKLMLNLLYYYGMYNALKECLLQRYFRSVIREEVGLTLENAWSQVLVLAAKVVLTKILEFASEISGVI